MKKSPSAAAIALAAILGSLAAPAAPVADHQGAPTVSQQTQRTNDNGGTQRAPTTANAQQQFDDPKRRLHRQGYNWKRQIRRRMEEAGFVSSGRQWKRMLREVQRMRRFDKSVLAMLNDARGEV